MSAGRSATLVFAIAALGAVVCTAQTSAPFTPEGTTWQYRLGDTTTHGDSPIHRLEVRAGPARVWGTVSSHGFGSYDATVACRSLGLPVESPHFGTMRSYGSTGSMPVYMAHIRCPNASVSSLDHCSYISETTSHYYDVGVHCANVTEPMSPPGAVWSYRLADVSTPGAGRLEIQKTPTGTWGTVCDDSFTSVDAEAACRSLGFAGDGATSYTAGGGTLPILMDETRCSSSSLYLENCPHSNSNDCSHSEDVGVRCINSNPAVDIPGGRGWQVRLGAGEGDNRGRLELRPSNATPWGSVCSASFTARDAIVACTSLGYNNVTAAAFYREGGGTGHVYMRDLVCSETDQYLTDCHWNSGDQTCAHLYDVGVDCSSDTYRYRLVGGAHNYTGRLEVQPNSSMPWGTVCSTSFNPTAAAIACESVFPGTSVASATWTQASATAGIGSGPIYLGGLQCRDRAQALGLCTNTESVLQHCTHADDVALSCVVSPKFNDTVWSFSLSPDHPMPYGGRTYHRLLVRPSPISPWGSVCDDYWEYRPQGLRNAAAACRSLGVNGAGADFRTAGSSYNPSSMSAMPIWIDDVRCPTSNESSLLACPLLYAHSNCGHYEDVYLYCGAAVPTPPPSTPPPPFVSTPGVPPASHSPPPSTSWSPGPHTTHAPGAAPPDSDGEKPPLTQRTVFIAPVCAAGGVVLLGLVGGGAILFRRRHSGRRRQAAHGAAGDDGRDVEAAPTPSHRTGKYSVLGPMRGDTEFAEAGAPPPPSVSSVNAPQGGSDDTALISEGSGGDGPRAAADVEEIEAL